jgi:hypothetical protein
MCNPQIATTKTTIDKKFESLVTVLKVDKQRKKEMTASQLASRASFAQAFKTD